MPASPPLLPEHLDPVFWEPDRLGTDSAWWGHVPFAHWLVAATHPRVLVELGTHSGVSYAAFCRAVAEGGLTTRCVAVDTWRGDLQAGHYGAAVYRELRDWHDARHAHFSRLVRADFDTARGMFGAGTIDLLHIDGLHDYPAVRHDFDTWRPALSDRGVVLLHDTEMREPGFEVWRLWDELRHRHPSFAFTHGYGLGVLAVGAHPPAALAALCAATGTKREARLRRMFATVGERWVSEQTLRQALAREAKAADPAA
ncbi:MAG: class I SAM-dependent methyltransferase [Acetobacteraceae bacterium]|nr:class I SAM-dependent methyltransferase [Acetobacteraceae bacterium]